MLTFTYRGEVLTIVTSTYETGGLAIQIFAEDGPYATLSTNFPGVSERLPEGVFYLKDWSENAPIANFLIEERLIIPVPEHDPIVSGFIMAEAFRLAPQSEFFAHNAEQFDASLEPGNWN